MHKVTVNVMKINAVPCFTCNIYKCVKGHSFMFSMEQRKCCFIEMFSLPVNLYLVLGRDFAKLNYTSFSTSAEQPAKSGTN